MRAETSVRFWAKVNKDGPIIQRDDTWPDNAPDPPGTPCWVWTAARHKRDGYGVFRADRMIQAHVWAYGHITAGFQLDHLCRNRPCVRRAHLQEVTGKTNTQRGRSARREQTHCKNGHEFTVDNTYQRGDRPGRQCITCRTDRKRGNHERLMALQRNRRQANPPTDAQRIAKAAYDREYRARKKAS